MSSEHKKTVFDMSKVKAANILEKYYKKEWYCLSNNTN